jgi:hypothetical protein
MFIVFKALQKEKSNIIVETYMENTIFCQELPGKATIVNCQLHAFTLCERGRGDSGWRHPLSGR